MVNRGGTKIPIVRKTSHNVPTVIIGHLDTKGTYLYAIKTNYSFRSSGSEILDSMLQGNETIDEIIDYFTNYTVDISGGPTFHKSNKCSRQSSMESEDTSSAMDNVSNLKRPDKTKSNKQSSQNDNLNTSKDLKGSKKSGNLEGQHKTQSNDQTDPNFQSRILAEDRLNQDDDKVRNIDIDLANAGIDDDSYSQDKAKNILNIINADFLKRSIPFMHPKTRKHSFKFFLEKVDEVVETVDEDPGLGDDDILDIMQFRMGGDYLTEMRDLRAADTLIVPIRTYFLMKDNEGQDEANQRQSDQVSIGSHEQ